MEKEKFGIVEKILNKTIILDKTTETHIYNKVIKLFRIPLYKDIVNFKVENFDKNRKIGYESFSDKG